MHIRTFRAASLQDALDEIRRQMGPEASVLHTRQVRDGWMGWLGRTYVEVTAGLKDSESTPLPAARRMELDSRSVTLDRYAVSAATGSVQTTGSRWPNPLQTYHDELVELGVDRSTVERWMSATVSFTANLGEDGTSTGSSWQWLEHLQRSVSRELCIGSPIRTHPGDRRVVALVGPTGVGKTTTVAKLAAGFRIQARRRVGLLTIDTFRIAAVQQLKAYAEIMDLPMEVVEQPGQMQPALDRLGDVDLVLIDTAGRSPRSDARIDQLVELLRSAKPDETHLVLSATSSPSTIRSVTQGFAAVRPTAAILTKLDEASHVAGVVSALVKSERTQGMPLSYLTNGQQVPDDIATASAEDLLARLLPSQMMPGPGQVEAA